MNTNPLCQGDNPQDVLERGCSVMAFVQSGSFERGTDALPLHADAQYGCFLMLDMCNEAIRHAANLYEARTSQA